ncbi:MAG: UvrD-helicase domain-containing protein [Planctomycetes bacterium]|nr:UvrD-helicase domain-containing protein [Planctomycetota bacterium]
MPGSTSSPKRSRSAAPSESPKGSVDAALPPALVASPITTCHCARTLRIASARSGCRAHQASNAASSSRNDRTRSGSGPALSAWLSALIGLASSRDVGRVYPRVRSCAYPVTTSPRGVRDASSDPHRTGAAWIGPGGRGKRPRAPGAPRGPPQSLAAPGRATDPGSRDETRGRDRRSIPACGRSSSRGVRPRAAEERVVTPRAAPVPREPADAPARRRIREDLATTFFVEAAAGTGKTTALVGRLLALLETGTSTLDRIAAVTFTEKAAGEMKLRLRTEIERARREGSDRARLDAALETLEVAHISTIHGLCGEILRGHPIEAGVDPLFVVAAQDEADALLALAFDRWFERVLDAPPEGVLRVLRREAGRKDGGPREALFDAVKRLADGRHLDASWRTEPFARGAVLDELVARLSALAALAPRAKSDKDWLARNLAEFGTFLDELRLQESVRGRDHDALERDLGKLLLPWGAHWHWKGSREYGDGLDRDAIVAERDAFKNDLEAALAASEAGLAALLQAELQPVLAAYAELKLRAGRLDFLDLLLRTRDLLRDDAIVRARLQRAFTHVFVDEFQDTDPLQAEILLLLTADDPAQSDPRRAVPRAGALFVVGDPKQSIYRFRGADMALYEETKARLVPRSAELLTLSTSFRARPAIQRAVNAAFAPLLDGNDGQAGWVPLEPWRADVTTRPSVIALPVPKPYGRWGKVYKKNVEDSLPPAVGAFLDWLVHDSGWTVEDDGELVPIRPRHVCLLFRRFQSWGGDVTRGYVRALEERRLPHVLVGGRSFHEREEVSALRAALSAVEWPDDELSVFATLRGPFFALGDDALLVWRATHGRLHPLRRVAVDAEDALLAPVAEALAVLRALHRGRNRRPVAHTLSLLLSAVRAHAGIAIWPTGEQSLANVLRVQDIARRFERRGASSFRAFVERLEDDAERGVALEAPPVEEGTEGVRIMTVHAAKGLEFPVVVLCDPTCHATGRHPTRHVDAARGLRVEMLCGCSPLELLEAAEIERLRDAQESQRLAYVAATRARELLVVPALGDGGAYSDEACWLDGLDPALRPQREARRKAAAAPGCPGFGDDSVLERPQEVGDANDGVKPGLHRAVSGGHDVVWWDPAALKLDAEAAVGLRQETILMAGEDRLAVDEGARAHAAWQAERVATRGGRPSVRAAPVTSLAERTARDTADAGAALVPPADAGVLFAAARARWRADAEAADATTRAVQRALRDVPEVEVHEVAGRLQRRPSGRRFGSLVHAVLATVDLRAASDAISAAARLQGRLLDASAAEIEAAAASVVRALAHDVLRAAARADALRRETPMHLRLPDGTVAEGVVDLAYRDALGWTVVDFKTDAVLDDERRASYATQVRLYARAVGEATGERARGLLLLV